MTKQTNKPIKFASILWFGVTAALLGFATIYIALRLAGNMIYPEASSNQAPAKVISKTMKQPSSKTASGSKSLEPLQATPPSSDVKNLPGNTTEVIKHKTLPVNIAGKSGGNPLLKGMNKGEMAAFLIRSTPIQVPPFSFVTSAGAQKNLSHWQGKVVLLNIWATWCIPCRKEMPDLDKLQASLGGKDFEVVTVNIDKGGLVKPARFFKKLSIKNLTLYGATSKRLTTLLRALGLPATILIGKNGQELGRLIGPANWASPDAIALIKAAMR